jgi:hypothetical protein
MPFFVPLIWIGGSVFVLGTGYYVVTHVFH